MRRRDALGRERAGDFGETSAARVLEPDPLDDASRKRRRPTGATPGCAATGRLAVAAEEALELVDGDKPLAPGQLDSVDRGDDLAVDGRDAHAERLSGLASRVGESRHLPGLPRLRGGGDGRGRFVNVALVRARLSRFGSAGLFKRGLQVEQPLGHAIGAYAMEAGNYDAVGELLRMRPELDDGGSVASMHPTKIGIAVAEKALTPPPGQKWKAPEWEHLIQRLPASEFVAERCPELMEEPGVERWLNDFNFVVSYAAVRVGESSSSATGACTTREASHSQADSETTPLSGTRSPRRHSESLVTNSPLMHTRA